MTNEISISQLRQAAFNKIFKNQVSKITPMDNIIDEIFKDKIQKYYLIWAVMDDISKSDSDQAYGPKDLAAILQELEAPTPSLNLSAQGLSKVVSLAFQVSFKKEEARYPRFQIYVPLSGHQNLKLTMRFNQPIPLEISTLHRLSSGIPPRPYALLVQESDSTLYAHGFLRIETSGIQFTSSPEYIISSIFPGLTVSIENPGTLNILHMRPESFVTNLTLRHGKIQLNYDSTSTPIPMLMYHSVAQSIMSNNQQYSKVIVLIRGIWSYILNLAVEFGHGGQFIILPEGVLLNDIKEFLYVKHQTVEPDLGESIRDINDINDNNIQDIQYSFQKLFDGARTVAQLSTVDGCIVFDRRLRLLGFGGETLVKNNVDCVQLDPNNVGLIEKGIFDLHQFGTRHRSAARLCARVKDTIAFVVSQDGDIRAFMQLENEKVGVCGPLRPLTGQSSPTIVS